MIVYIIITILLALLIVQHLQYRQLKQKIAVLESANKESEKEQENLPSPSTTETASIELPANPKSESGQYKLLVIEDHKDIQLYMKVLFSKEYELHIAENGEEGLKKAEEIVPDLIITDIMMPVMNGFECTRLLKENHTTCHIPIIQVTALSDDNNAIKGMELGADDYITKPFSPEILKTKVKRLIKNRQDLKEFYTQLFKPLANKEEKSQTNKEKVLKQIEGQDPIIPKLFSEVEKNIANKELCAKYLADELNVSLPTLYRKTGQFTGLTVAEIIRSTRMKKAGELLKEHKFSISETGEAVGYSDPYTFRKHFVEFYGIKPSEFSRDAGSYENNLPS